MLEILLATVVALSAAPGPAAAVADTAAIQPTDVVPGHPGLTYLDLIRQVAPSLALSAEDKQFEGEAAKPFHHIGGPEYEGPPPDPLVLGFIQDRRILVGGKRRMLILADLGYDPDRVQSAALLLLFDDAPKPRLLDVADVSIDKDTEFAEDIPRTSLGRGDEAIVTYSEHDDADLTMGGYVLISPIGDRLRMIGIAPVVSEKLCGWTRIESAQVATAPDPGVAHPRIDLIVRAKVTRNDDGDCGDDQPKRRVGTRTFRAIYRWSNAAGRYQVQSSQMKALTALNDKDF